MSINFDVKLYSGTTQIFDKDGLEISESRAGNFYLHTGREYDAETGLYYHRARYRSSVFGTWLSKDPIGFAGGINVYGYVNGSPTNWIDSDGLLKVHIWDYKGKNQAWGHASMTLKNGKHISWWPAQPRDQSKISQNIYSAPARPDQTLLLDAQFEGQNPDHEIEINGLDEEAIDEWWEKFRKENKWETLGQNCSTTVSDGLKAGGACKYSSWWKSHNSVWTPEDVKEFSEDIANNIKQNDCQEKKEK